MHDRIYAGAIREMVDSYARHSPQAHAQEVVQAVTDAMLARGVLPPCDIVPTIKQEFAAHA